MSERSRNDRFANCKNIIVNRQNEANFLTHSWFICAEMTGSRLVAGLRVAHFRCDDNFMLISANSRQYRSRCPHHLHYSPVSLIWSIVFALAFYSWTAFVCVPFPSPSDDLWPNFRIRIHAMSSQCCQIKLNAKSSLLFRGDFTKRFNWVFSVGFCMWRRHIEGEKWKLLADGPPAFAPHFFSFPEVVDFNFRCYAD